MDDQAENVAAAVTEWSVAPDAPERDGRVIWLIEEIGGFDAIAHRHEDILRQRFGRSQPGRGRPIVQPGIETEDVEPGSDPEQTLTLQQEMPITPGPVCSQWRITIFRSTTRS